MIQVTGASEVTAYTSRVLLSSHRHSSPTSYAPRVPRPTACLAYYASMRAVVEAKAEVNWRMSLLKNVELKLQGVK